MCIQDAFKALTQSRDAVNAMPLILGGDEANLLDASRTISAMINLRLATMLTVSEASLHNNDNTQHQGRIPHIEYMSLSAWPPMSNMHSCS